MDKKKIEIVYSKNKFLPTADCEIVKMELWEESLRKDKSLNDPLFKIFGDITKAITLIQLDNRFGSGSFDHEYVVFELIYK